MKFIFVHISICIMLSACAFLAPSTKKAKDYFIQTPTTWKKIERGESDIAYQLTSGSIVTVNSLCSEITTTNLELLTKHLLFGTRDIIYEKQEKITIDKEEALFSKVTVTMKNKKINLALIVFIKDSCIFDFSIMNSKNLSNEEISEFLNFTKSFKYGRN